jgi:hypothetical protein
VLRFERTSDMVLVREVMTHPRVWPFITDDGCPPVNEFQPVEHPGIWYVLCLDDEELLGLWMFVPATSVCFEVHTCLLPGHGYRRSREAAKQAAAWIWANTQCQRIFTNVPMCNVIAMRFAEAAGMVEFGVNARSFLKGGILQDQALLGLSRPKEQSCQQQ